jgi:hypothetical protein
MADLCEQIRDNDRFARAGHWETLSFVERQRNSRCLISPVKANSGSRAKVSPTPWLYGTRITFPSPINSRGAAVTMDA